MIFVTTTVAFCWFFKHSTANDSHSYLFW